MKKVISERKDIVFHIIMYPLPMHANAYEKSKAIVCEKSLKLLEDAFEYKELPKAKCETKALDENIEAGKKLGITGTPALIFPDGSLISGSTSAESIIKMIDKK